MYICTATFLSTCLLMGPWVVSIYLLNFCCGNPHVHGRMNIQTLYTCNGVSSFPFFSYFFSFLFYPVPFFFFSVILSTSITTSLPPSLPLFFLPVFLFFKRFYLFIFSEMGRGEREGGKHQCEREILTSCPMQAPRSGDRTYNPDMCPDQQSNQ